MRLKILLFLGLVLVFNLAYGATRVVMCEEYYWGG
jgi:hypothetical protein